MDILCSFIGGNGHFQPLVPYAHALQDAGHDVSFYCDVNMAETVRKAGFTVQTYGEMRTSMPERTPLLGVDLEREARDLRDIFARDAAREKSLLMHAFCQRQRPDVIICDEVDFGTMIAAEALNIPYVVVSVIAAGDFIKPEVVADALNEVRTTYNLAPDPDLEMLSRHLILLPFPASYRDLSTYPLPKTAYCVQPFENLASDDNPFAGMKPDLPNVYFTLGTIFNKESGDVFERVLDGLRPLPINVLVTVGKYIDPAIFVPDEHIRIQHYVPQLSLLPHCDLVISHGGSGTVIATLAHGIPMVLIPIGADQPNNAERCRHLGCAEVLDPVALTASDLSKTVQAVLTDPKYRHQAETLQSKFQQLPPIKRVVPLIENLNYS